MAVRLYGRSAAWAAAAIVIEGAVAHHLEILGVVLPRFMVCLFLR